jgi:GAF domain-containing protein
LEPETLVHSSHDLADALSNAAEQINTRRALPEVLQTLVETAQRSLPGADHVGISVFHSDGRIETLAASDDFVLRLDTIQYQLNEGPCIDAMREQGVVVASRAELARRWPRFMAQAVPLGLRSQMGVRLFIEGQTLGGLNLYSTRADHFNGDLQHVAQLFASHASLALGKARLEQTMTDGMLSRQRIGQAIGILMQKYELDEDRAFAYLARVSQTSNIKVRDIADEVVEAANRANRLPANRPHEEGM